MRNEINEANLKSGAIACTGWNQESLSVSVWDYFGKDGEYLGPDDDGLEPKFEDASE